jgi:hypothetical protein
MTRLLCMSRTPRVRGRSVLVSTVFVGGIVASCGARTGLLLDEPFSETDATATDGSQKTDSPVGDEIQPIFEGGKLDVVTDCATPTYCDPSDLSYIWKCGVRIEQCSSLEQCEVRCNAADEDCGAQCVNPCADTLGQNTSNGCEFYSVDMDVTEEAEGACFAVFVVNQWKTGEPARLELDHGGAVLPIENFARIPVGTGTSIQYQPFDANAGLATNQVAILFLARDPAAKNGQPTDPQTLANCPAGVTPAVVGDAALHGTGRGTAFHLKSNVPVVAYQMLPYGGGSARITGATLLLPTNVWGTNYLAANAYTAPLATMIDEPRAGPTMDIVAAQDGTTVTLLPTATVQAGPGVSGGAKGSSVSYSLDHGQYLQFTQPAELTGSIVSSNKPVAVFGGSTLADVPVTVVRADGREHLLGAVGALGSEYVAVRYRARRNRGDESVPWRIVGAVNGTQLVYEPTLPPGAPIAVGAQEVAEFDAPGPFVVRSQDDSHPFYFAQYMTGGQIAAEPLDPINGEGDPEYLNVTPPGQYLPRYTFFTDPTYPETNLTVVRVKDAASGLFPDVSLDCAGVLGGWTALGSSGTYQWTRIDLSTGDFQGQNGCDNGVHTIVGTLASGGGTASFGVNVWGWGNTLTFPTDNGGSDEANPAFTRWVSYAYPAGANFQPLNSVTVPATH